MSEIKFIALPELIEVLKEVKHAMPATFIAATSLDMPKTNNEYYGRIVKLQKSNVFIKFDYANAVNKQRLKEGKEADFVPKARPWGVRVGDSTLIEHKGEYYLEARYLLNHPKIEYLLDGKDPIDESKFSQYIKEVKTSTTQDLEKEIVIRTIKMVNIREITLNGTRYVRSDL